MANTVKFFPVYPLTVSDDDEENNASIERNPLERITDSYKYQERFQQNYNVGLNWKPFKNITFRTEFGYRWDYNNTDQVWGSEATTNSKYGFNGQPQAVFTKVNKQNWRNANTVTYDNSKLFGGRDRINVLVGQEWSSSRQTTRTSTSVEVLLPSLWGQGLQGPPDGGRTEACGAGSFKRSPEASRAS